MTSRFIMTFLTALLAAACAPGAAAQRTAKDEGAVDMGFCTSASGPHLPGAYVSYGRYGLDFLWRAGVTFSDRPAPTIGGTATDVFTVEVNAPASGYDVWELEAGGDFMYRLAGTYTRRAGLYAGGGLFMGWTGYGLTRPVEGGCGLEGGFSYGMRACAEAELFVTDRTALTLGARVPVTLGTDLYESTGKGLVRLETAAGLRFNF